MARPEPTEALLGEFLPDADALEVRTPVVGSRLTLYALLAMLCTAVAWGSLSRIDMLVISRGRLVTPLPNLVVQPLEPGILKSIDVRIGQIVQAGSVLATLDATFASADSDQLHSRFTTLTLEIARLQAEIDGADTVPETRNDQVPQRRLQEDLLNERRAAYTARLRQFQETVAAYQAALGTNLRDQEALADQVTSLADLETMHLALENRKMGSRASLLEVQSRRLALAREYTLAQNRAKEIERQIAATDAERESFVKSWRQDLFERLSEATQECDEVEELLAKARRRTELVTLTTPLDAVVLEIGKKSVGSVVRDAEPLFVLVPLNAPLEAEIEVSPADVGRITAGDAARVKVDAWPFQKHGTIGGEVINVSADTFSRDNAVAGTSYYYLVRISLLDTRLKHLPDPLRLLPGMTISGEVVTGRRTVISYFLYPVIRVLDESLHER